MRKNARILRCTVSILIWRRKKGLGKSQSRSNSPQTQTHSPTHMVKCKWQGSVSNVIRESTKFSLGGSRDYVCFQWLWTLLLPERPEPTKQEVWKVLQQVPTSYRGNITTTAHLPAVKIRSLIQNIRVAGIFYYFFLLAAYFFFWFYTGLMPAFRANLCM